MATPALTVSSSLKFAAVTCPFSAVDGIGLISQPWELERTTI